MKDKLQTLRQRLHPARLTELAAFLLKDEAISGKLIIGALILALLAANSGLADAYQNLWKTELGLGFGDWSFSLDLKHWISDGLMAFFFLVVGLELRRELSKGELRSLRAASLPIAAAIGGMLVPALIYLSLNLGRETVSGWAIPVATDIALAIGLLALLGKRIPSTVRIFLLTLAIVDDIAAVAIIALFYSGGINTAALLGAVALLSLITVLRNTRYVTLFVFSLVGIVVWFLTYQSGIHASIAGAALGLLAPLSIGKDQVASLAERLEKAIIPFTTLFVVPVFALANTGIKLSFDSFQNDSALYLSGGIIIGLVVGKVLGIFGASWLMVRFGLSTLPSQANWNHIIGVGMLAGIGFTVSIFVTELAFDDESFINAAKISIFIASAVSAALGLFALRFLNPKQVSPK